MRRQTEIVEAAMELFHERGYANTSVQDLADAVGILKGSLYYHIDSKQDLLFRIIEEVHESVEAIQREIDARTDLTALEKLDAYVRARILNSARNRRRIAVYYDARARFGEPRMEQIRRWRADQERFVEDLVRDAAAGGEVPPELDVRLATKSVFAVMVGLHTWYRPSGATSPKMLSEFCAQFVLDGLKAGAATVDVAGSASALTRS